MLRTTNDALRMLLLAGLIVGSLVGAGCSCREETDAERAAREAKAAEEEKRRLEEELSEADLVLEKPSTLPAAPGEPALYFKPGHWATIVQPVVAKTINFEGRVTQTLTDAQGDPIAIPRTRFRMSASRPLVMAQQSTKGIESSLYCPATEGPKELATQVVEHRNGQPRVALPKQPLYQLLDHQYHFIVLAKEPRRYAFLDALQSVTTRLPGYLDTSEVAQGAKTLPAGKNYRVVPIAALPRGDGLPLPASLMAWTSTAYLLWDEVDPALLRPAQRDALIDWINWGGQLVVSGPDSLDLLRGSFLEPFLPATSTGARTIGKQELAKLNAHWNASQKRSNHLPQGEWSGIGLRAVSGSQTLPGLEGLLVEHRVGRGRIVVSGFQLAQRELIDWAEGVENLYNGALLRRPPRRFAQDRASQSGVMALWDQGAPIRIDPRRNSKVRLLVHDTHAQPDDLALRLQRGAEPADPAAPAVALLNLEVPKVRGGVAAWDETNLLTEAARKVLRRSAGVSIPGASFVAFCLLLYLVTLVPANGFFFHALGRVEWAWIAAPLIAMGGGWGIAHVAQLDIGFVRSQTEVGLLEVQPDSPRGLLSRFTALYTSLSTPYEIEYEAQGTVALPFSPLFQQERFERSHYPTPVILSQQQRSRLQGVAVASASTELVRSAEMIDFEGAVPEGSQRRGGVRMGESLSGVPRLENHTEWDLESVALVGRRDGIPGAAQLEGCWIGQLASGNSASIAFLPIDASDEAIPFRAERAEEAIALGRSDRALDLQPLLRAAMRAEDFEPGERRVVARINQPVAGIATQPSASQRRGATLLVIHLHYGPLAPPQHDRNAPTDFTAR